MPRCAVLFVLMLSLVSIDSAQELGDLSGNPAHARELVSYIAEPQLIPANRKAILEVHLGISEGFHVNSHAPRSDLLLPTVLTVAPEQGTALSPPEYPAGKSYQFTGSTDTLDVYTGLLTVRLPVVAHPGAHLLHATLHYQACDHASCYPPRKLAVSIPFTAQP